MTAVHAPKDAEKKRPAICIMRDKRIFGNPQNDGTGIQYLYLNNGRLQHFARINGNVEDEETIEMLEHAGTFRKMVHSIGITMTGEDLTHTGEFVLQMYGTDDPDVGGVTWKKTVIMNGVEQRIILAEEAGCEDEAITGQIRVILPEGETVELTVVFYLNDGFKAPEMPDTAKPVLEGEAYRKLIGKSLMSLGNPYRLQLFLEKARRGEPVTVAFIGGSITQGAGAIPISRFCYAMRFYEKICEYIGPENAKNVRFVKAGAGGTSSELGMIRYAKDVTNDGEIHPDLVVVEYAVNDNDDELQGQSFDSLVRKIYNAPESPAVMLIFAVFADDFNLQDRHRKVGEAYGLPMVSVKDAVVPQFYQKEERVISKSQYFYDVFHPSNAGHEIMADGLMYALKAADLAEKAKADTDISGIEPPYSGEYENIVLIDRDHCPGDVEIHCGSFSDTDEDLQKVERDKNPEGTPEFPANWCHRIGDEPFVMDLSCKALFICNKDSGSGAFGKADVFVDGKLLKTIDPRKVGWTHCNAFFLFNEEKPARHHVEVRMAEGDRDKWNTILGFGAVL